jgi:hypothetical protein
MLQRLTVGERRLTSRNRFLMERVKVELSLARTPGLTMDA